MIETEPNAELQLPPPGSIIPGAIGYILVLFFVFVSVSNLLFANQISNVSLIASLLWLALVTFVVWANIREEGGTRQYFINRLGQFSRLHFVRVSPSDENADNLSFGYTIFGRDLYFLHIKSNLISTLEWSSGQATAMSGRDMNDWSVALWYHHPAGPQRKPFPGVRVEQIYIIGPSGPRLIVESLGQQLVKFFINSGVNMIPGSNNCEFVAHSHDMTKEQRVESGRGREIGDADSLRE